MANYKDIAAVHFQCNPLCDSGPSHTEDVLAQFKHAEELVDGTGLDLLVTCEGMESVGQTMDEAESIDSPGPLMTAYADFAKRNNCTVMGSTKLLENGRIYNALVAFEGDGSVAGAYCKNFLTDGEHSKGMSPGVASRAIQTKAGKVAGVICFDLNFAELRDSYVQQQPDILAFASMFNGSLMQQEWAYHCRCFLAAACKDGNSRILDPLGRTLATASHYTRVARARVNLDRFAFHCDHNRLKMPEICRQYGKQVLVDIDPELGTGLLYSCADGLSAADIAREYELTDVDDYFTTARHLRGEALESSQRKAPC